MRTTTSLAKQYPEDKQKLATGLGYEENKGIGQGEEFEVKTATYDPRNGVLFVSLRQAFSPVKRALE